MKDKKEANGRDNRGQIQRISRMETILREAERVCAGLDAALERYASLREDLGALEHYYGSEDWREDLSCDERGLLPPDLKRGVLSQDEVYDLLRERDRLLARMGELLKEEQTKEVPKGIDKGENT